MLNLAFDTTAQSCSVILTRDGVTLDKSIQKMDFGQSEALMPAIKNILDKNGLKMKEIDLVTVCTGPGSFTGVRSSLSAARTFELALPEIGLTGVSAFEAYMEDLAPDELAEVNAVIIETKRNDFYFQAFDVHKKAIEAPQALNYEDIIDKLRNHKVTFTGDGVERFLSKPSGLSLHVINMPDIPPIAALARCGIERWNKKNLDYPKPLYLRAPDVCVKA
uniref:tRNA (Adenosine(37)-N6)-threonylcarbamoyltransferase complex dimerization subunit type 1 TsaB n=1 Tax=uncultured Alphaproteobacteria bacterium TaxID=91750 RepID=A0A6M4NN25_9PROT|nr:tRNA (adenosine(37)-N6)-threonylcarbamoyltransferase complex dimerization subunit type 1 TsaB [uncultured Alphaproteobacteria bacterium]